MILSLLRAVAGPTGCGRRAPQQYPQSQPVPDTSVIRTLRNSQKHRMALS